MWLQRKWEPKMLLDVILLHYCVACDLGLHSQSAIVSPASFSKGKISMRWRFWRCVLFLGHGAWRQLLTDGCEGI
jgi:hypothetical protein